VATPTNVTAEVAWEWTLKAVSRLLRIFDNELQQAVGIPLNWYDVLLQLYVAPEMKLRMQVLSDSLVLTRSGATRLVDRIEKAGLVRREPAVEDRRGYYAILTDTGEQILQRARLVHRAGIANHFGHHLSSHDQEVLYAIMGNFWTDSTKLTE